MLIKLIDTFMDSIAISWKGAMLFALITALIHWLLEEKSEEPPMADSEEFKRIEEKIISKK